MIHVHYHDADLDGICSAAVARYFLQGTPHVLIPFNYNKQIHLETVDKKKDEIWFLDVSTNPPSRIQDLIDEGYKICICDHHKSFLDTGTQKRAFSSNCNTQFAGCELTYQWLCRPPEVEGSQRIFTTSLSSQKLPEIVRLIGRYDVWDKSSDISWERLMDFQYGMRARNWDPYNKEWGRLLEERSGSLDLIREITKEGSLILKYQSEFNKRLMGNSFSARLGGWKALCVNQAFGNSNTFDSIWDESKYDIMFLFSFNGKCTSVSLYTTKSIDCSEIAKSFGGGGHAKAAGFLCKSVSVDDGILIIERT